MGASGRRLPVARLLTALAGVVLILLGLILWILPVVPGFGLVLVGLPMVMAVHPRGRATVARWRRRAGATWAECLRRRRGRN